MPRKVKLHFQSSAQARASACEEAVPTTLADLQHLAWQRFDAWWHCGGDLPHELRVLHLRWANGGREKVSSEVRDEEQYQAALRQGGQWCEFKIEGSTAGARWDLLWSASVDIYAILREYRARAEALFEFAGLDREELQWMRGLPHGQGPLVDLAVAGRSNAGKSLLASALLGRPSVLPSSRFTFTRHASVVGYGKAVSAELRRGGLQGCRVRSWQQEPTLDDLLMLHGYQPAAMDSASSCLDSPRNSEDSPECTCPSGASDFVGDEAVTVSGADALVVALPHPFLRAGLQVTEWSASAQEAATDVEQCLAGACRGILPGDDDVVAARVLIWCIDVHGRLDAEFKALLRVAKSFPGTPVLVALTQAGECSGAERELERSLVKEASRIVQTCIPGLPAENIVPVSARAAVERASRGERPPAPWRVMVERLCAIISYQLNSRLTDNWSVDVPAAMEAACAQRRPSAHSHVERLSPLVGIRGALSSATLQLQSEVRQRLGAAAPSRRSAVLALELPEDSSVLDPSAGWYAAHREVYIQEVRKATEEDPGCVSRLAEIVSEINADLDARLARAAVNLCQTDGGVQQGAGGVALDASASTVIIDILYSGGFTGVNQRAWPEYLRCQSEVLTDAALSYVASPGAEGAAEGAAEAPHKKGWLFDRLEAEALSAAAAGFEDRKMAALKRAELRYEELLQGYLEAQRGRRRALIEEYRRLHSHVVGQQAQGEAGSAPSGP